MENVNCNESRIELLRLSRKPFPLRYLLFLYHTAHKKDVYCDYFEGFQLLVAWLGPIELPDHSTKPTAPHWFITYESQEIARILHTDWQTIYWTLKELE